MMELHSLVLRDVTSNFISFQAFSKEYSGAWEMEEAP